MSHLEHHTLWALAKAELSEEARARAQAHLNDCPDCRVTLEDVRLAQANLMALPPVPPMPAALARRVGQAIEAAAEERARPSFFGLPLFSRWPHAADALLLAAIAAAIVVAVVQRGSTAGSTTTTPPTPITQVLPLPTPGPAPQPAQRPTMKKLQVQVASARKARLGTGALARKQVLEEGATVSTDKGGALWLSLPDGSRAGLTGSTDVQLAKLEQGALTLEVTQGSLAMVVPHREDRVLVVRAGEVQVKDLGTRFLVSRDVARVVVAVEEGSVQVTTPEKEETVRAGHALTWEGGHATRASWDVPKPVAVAQAVPKSAARLAEDEADAEPQTPAVDQAPRGASQPPSPGPSPTSASEPPPATQPVYGPPRTAPEGEWATLPPEAAAPPAGASGQPAVAPAPQPVPTTQLAPQPFAPPLPPSTGQPALAPPPPLQPVPMAPLPGTQPPPRSVATSSPPASFSGVGFSLKEVERRLHELKRTIRDPVIGGRPQEVRGIQAGDVGEMAEDGDCVGALMRADAWLSAPPTNSGQELGWRRSVLKQKVRCLARLHRDAEAAQTQAELDGLPQ